MADTKLQYIQSLNNLNFKQRMGESIDQTKLMDKTINSVGKNASNLKIPFGQLKGLIAGAFSIAAVTRFEKAVVESLKKQEYFSVSLKTLLRGNVNEAKALEAQLVQLAKTTPFSLEEVNQGTRQLLAYGFEAGKVTDTIRMLGDVSAGVGAPLGDIVYLYGTLRTQGRAFAKDIYQFTNRGIDVVSELAKQFKVTKDKVAELVSEGKVGFKEIERAFKTMTSEGGAFFKLMEDQSKTIGGKLSNLSDVWEQIRVNIGKQQKGILAQTISWAESMSNVLLKRLTVSNFIDESTAGLKPEFQLGMFSDHKKDELPRAYRFGESKTFQTKAERDAFLFGNNGANKNAGWNEIAGVGTNERLRNFSSDYLDRFNKVAGMPESKQAIGRGELLSQIKKDRTGIISAMQQGKISTDLGVNELSVLDNLFNRIKGLIDLSKSAIRANKNSAAGGGSSNDSSTGIGIETATARPQNLNITIEHLGEIGTIEINNVSEGKEKIKQMISEALIEAVNDVNYMDRQNGK